MSFLFRERCGYSVSWPYWCAVCGQQTVSFLWEVNWTAIEPSSLSLYEQGDKPQDQMWFSCQQQEERKEGVSLSKSTGVVRRWHSKMDELWCCSLLNSPLQIALHLPFAKQVREIMYKVQEYWGGGQPGDTALTQEYGTWFIHSPNGYLPHARHCHEHGECSYEQNPVPYRLIQNDKQQDVRKMLGVLSVMIYKEEIEGTQKSERIAASGCAGKEDFTRRGVME